MNLNSDIFKSDNNFYLNQIKIYFLIISLNEVNSSKCTTKNSIHLSNRKVKECWKNGSGNYLNGKQGNVSFKM